MLREPFAVGNSILHRLDPRVRLISAAAYSSVVALSRNFQVLITAVIISFILVLFAQLPARDILKRILAVNVFILLLWLVLPLTFYGSVAMKLGPLPVYSAGIAMAAQITLKSNAIVLALIALVATMNFSILGYSLNWLRVPDKIVHLLLMTYRYVFLIEQEYQRLIRAMKIRAFKPGTNLHSYQSYAYLVGMLFVHASARADRVSNAMKCRGFTGRFHSLWQFEKDSRNWFFALIMSFIIILMAMVELWIQATHS